MKAQYTLPSELAREWSRRRWLKPNAKAREAQAKTRKRIAAAQLDGDMAVLAVIAYDTYRALVACTGQLRLKDDRPLAGRDTPSLGGDWEGGGTEPRGTPFHPVRTPSEILALECFGMEEEAWRDSKAALANSSGTQLSGLTSRENDSRQNAKPRGPSGPGADGASKKKRKKRKRRRISDSGKQGNGKRTAKKPEQRFC